MYINIYVQVSKYVASESNNNILSIVDVVVATLSPKVCSFLAGRVYWRGGCCFSIQVLYITQWQAVGVGFIMKHVWI